MDSAVDIETIVVGAGMSGLTVAATLSRLGHEVGVVELGKEVGGSAAMSEGFVWTSPDDESFLRQDPGGDVEKFRAMRAEFESAMTDVRALGIDVGPDLIGVLGYGEGNQIDIGGYLAWCKSAVEAGGGWVVVEHDVVELLTADSRVSGARVKDVNSAETFDVAADVVVLATGGFQADPELRAKYLGERTRCLPLRANPQSAGRGLELGLSVGAGESRGFDAFYGHLIPTPISRWEPNLFTALSQYYSEYGVLLNRAGQRFVDESLGDHVLAQEVAKIGTALLFIDSIVWETHARSALLEGMDAQDKVKDAKCAGGRVSIANDLDTLIAPVGEWGFDPGGVLATLHQVQNENAGPDGTALDVPPFALLEVQPAITFTYGGLATDMEGRILKRDGSPIDGLRAVGIDAGGLNVRGYTGGLVRGLTLGRVTARSIHKELTASS